ncbi:hypothetical protein Nepgr_014831 [Nepenthes gracilis]|uniref:Uncharacterized protein n=1 Tax=Nepenthes gracilis TaxID=150966 RepID=A0AAD3XQV6_NEPGR|nr:hypothetical protein Nepgr_014831 [Nepenthes gracilis]
MKAVLISLVVESGWVCLCFVVASRCVRFIDAAVMLALQILCSSDAHDGAVGNPLNVQLLLFLLPALEPKMVLLVSVLEHSDVVPCRATVWIMCVS